MLLPDDDKSGNQLPEDSVSWAEVGWSKKEEFAQPVHACGTREQPLPEGQVCLVAIEAAADRLPLLERRTIEKWHDTKCNLETQMGEAMVDTT